jgi:Radical SAM superfamily/B12 binding domain
MKLLLINSNRFKHPWPVIPFGLCCVAAAAETAGHEVRVLDLCFASHPEKDIDRCVREYPPDVVGVSIRNIDNAVGYNTKFILAETRERVIQPCKRVFKGPILIGGPAVGINAAEMLHFLELEFAIRGDGEQAIVEFLERLSSQEPLDGLPGLVRRVENRILEDNEPSRISDLNTLRRRPPTRYIDISPYKRFGSPLQIQTKRGCALQCTYCTYNRIEGHRYRLRSPEKVADEIESLMKETGIHKLEFTDSTFNVPLGHAKSVLRALIGKNLQLDLRTMGLNPGAVDEELADLMVQAGFQDVDLGAEAGCDEMLTALGKNFTTADILRAGRLLRERQIPVTWYLLLGAPGETIETVNRTLDTITKAASPWDLINIAVGIRVYNGSPIADRLLDSHPGITRDNFLQPVSLPEGTGIGLNQLKKIVKLRSFKNDNFFMYDEDERTPELLMQLGIFLLNLFAPRQPIWRLFIIIRKIQSLLGIRRVQEMWYLKKG